MSSTPGDLHLGAFVLHRGEFRERIVEVQLHVQLRARHDRLHEARIRRGHFRETGIGWRLNRRRARLDRRLRPHVQPVNGAHRVARADAVFQWRPHVLPVEAHHRLAGVAIHERFLPARSRFPIEDPRRPRHLAAEGSRHHYIAAMHDRRVPRVNRLDLRPCERRDIARREEETRRRVGEVVRLDQRQSRKISAQTPPSTMPSRLSSWTSKTRSHCTSGNGSVSSPSTAFRSAASPAREWSNWTALISTLPASPLDCSIRRAMLASETIGIHARQPNAAPPNRAESVSTKPAHRPALPKCSHASSPRKITRSKRASAPPAKRKRTPRDQRYFCADARRRWWTTWEESGIAE